MLVAAIPSRAGSKTDFTLGLRAEYIGEKQEIEDVTSEQTTLRASIFLAFDGYISNPKALSFSGFVERAATDYEQTETSSGTKSVVDDSRYDQTFYSLGLRALSALPVSVGGGTTANWEAISGPNMPSATTWARRSRSRFC